MCLPPAPPPPVLASATVRTRSDLVAGLLLGSVWLIACDSNDAKPSAGEGDTKPPPTEAEDPAPAQPAAACEAKSQRHADRDCLRKGNDPVCASLTKDLGQHCGGKKPAGTKLPLPPEAAAALTPQRLCDLSLRVSKPVSQEHCERRYEIAIELFGLETFRERAKCWLTRGRTLELSGPCTGALEFPTLSPPQAQIDRAVALLAPWCEANSEQCDEHGVCSAVFGRWEATTIGGLELGPGAAVGCEATDESCAKTDDCRDHGECTAMDNGIGCYVADEEACKKSAFCARMGMCELHEGERPGLPPLMGRYCANPKD